MANILVNLSLETQHLGSNSVGTLPQLILASLVPLLHTVASLHHHPSPKDTGGRVVCAILSDKSPEENILSLFIIR